MSDLNFSLPVTTGQGYLLAPEVFQDDLIRNMGSALLRENHPPCLLRAPTGSGKTFMLTRLLADVSAERDVIWLWFVPFVTLVAQTQDAIKTNAADLTPMMLNNGRNENAESGQVLISTVQAVARAQWRRQGYNSDADDETRTLAEWLIRVRAQGLDVGLVVDEAHIALDKATEFGKFAQWLTPDYLIMATATPKDKRLLDFLGSAGKSSYEDFTVSRSEVVEARLNKKYIEAVVYGLRESVQEVADLKRTVLRQAWMRNQKLNSDLEASGVGVTPLLLVQVANGENTVEEAERDLINLCKVPPQAIGKHSADDPDPVLMAAIANDTRKQVLIFKQSAGTGFDAPRAFVLASLKPVNDPDFAMQFIGRVMRVAPAIRGAYSSADDIPEDFNSAYVYLANADAQRGFEQAVTLTSQVKSQLEGQTEKMTLRKTVSGATVITNKSSNQIPLTYDMKLPNASIPEKNIPVDDCLDKSVTTYQQDIFSENSTSTDLLDELVPLTTKNRKDIDVQSQSDLVACMSERGVRIYEKRTDLLNLPKALKRELKPELLAMGQLSKMVSVKLDIPSKLLSDSIKVSQNRLQEQEYHTELTTGRREKQIVRIVTDRTLLARDARQALRQLPQVEEDDIRIILATLADRVKPELIKVLDDRDEYLEEREVTRQCRDAANWIAKLQADKLAEALYEAIADKAETIDAGPLPDGMAFVEETPLAAAQKNIYGVFPPSKEEINDIDRVLLQDDRKWLHEKTFNLKNENYLVGQFDKTSSMNTEEHAFAKALDRSDFVAWWHRNPDRKSYSVQLVRGEHHHYFHPDFIVCLEHYPGDEPIIRLVETKENVKDAARKAKHVPSYYGKVLFLTKNKKRLVWVNDDGSLGSDVDLDDLDELRDWLRKTRPNQMPA